MSNLIYKQQKQIDNRDLAINQLADQVLNLQQQVILLQKSQKDNIIAIDKKMDTKKCIQLTTNIGRTHQQQIETYQNKIQDATSHLTKLDFIQKENSALILGKINMERCIEITNNIEKSCHTRMQNHENKIRNSILNITASDKNKDQEIHVHKGIKHKKLTK
jgi:hypothetical protein